MLRKVRTAFDDKRQRLTHDYIYNEGDLPRLNYGDIFIYGYTHIPKVQKHSNIYMINSGPIALPKEN